MNAKYTEGKIRKEAEWGQERENVRKVVAKRLSAKAGGA